MAELLNKLPDHPKVTFEVIDNPQHLRLTVDGVLIERHADGTLQIFADPERFSIMTRAGRGEGGTTGPLKSLVVISPTLHQIPAVAAVPPPQPSGAAPLPAQPSTPRRSPYWEGNSVPNAPTHVIVPAGDHATNSNPLRINNSAELRGPE